MNQLWLFLHFMGLIMGAGPGLANMVIMKQSASASPEGAQALRAVPPILINVSITGLAILWVTGLILVWSHYDGLASLPTMFWVKFVFILTLTAAAIGLKLTAMQIRKTGNMALAARMPMLGAAAGLSATLAVLFAVIAFM